MGRGLAGDRRRPERRPCRWRPHRLRRHHLLAAAGKRDGRGRRDQTLPRRHGHLHHARLSVPGGRCADDQLPPAEVDAVHAGQRLRRSGRDEGGPTPTRWRTAIASTPMATGRCCSATDRGSGPKALPIPGVAVSIEPQPIMQAERSVAPELHRSRRDAPAGPAVRGAAPPDHRTARFRDRPPPPRPRDPTAGAIGPRPRRRSGFRARGWRNRRRPRPPSPARPRRAPAPDDAATSSGRSGAAAGRPVSSTPLALSLLE